MDYRERPRERIVTVVRVHPVRPRQLRPPRGRVVAAARGQSPARQEGAIGRRPRQPPQIVVAEGVRPGRVHGLGQPRVVVVGVGHGRRVRISLRREAIHVVIAVRNRLPLAVSLGQQIPHRIVSIALAEGRRERDPGERGVPGSSITAFAGKGRPEWPT